MFHLPSLFYFPLRICICFDLFFFPTLCIYSHNQRQYYFPTTTLKCMYGFEFEAQIWWKPLVKNGICRFLIPWNGSYCSSSLKNFLAVSKALFDQEISFVETLTFPFRYSLISVFEPSPLSPFQSHVLRRLSISSIEPNTNLEKRGYPRESPTL